MEGVGPATARLIRLFLAVDRRYHQHKTRPVRTVKSLEEVGEHMESLFYGARVEQVYAMYLDDRNHILKVEKCFEGTVNASSVFVNVLSSRMITLGATQLVLAHNHPRGFALPSREDMNLTGQICQKLGTLGLKLVDHVIVAPDGHISLRQSDRFQSLFT